MNATDKMKELAANMEYYGQVLLEGFMFHGGKAAGRIAWIYVVLKNMQSYVYAQSYFPECELKNKYRILIEQLWYIIRHGEINKNYFIYGFDRKDKKDKSEYVPWLDFARARDRRNKKPKGPQYDFYNYVCMLKDKILFEAYCSRLHIKTSINHAYIKDRVLYVYEKDEYLPLKSIANFQLDTFLKKNVSYGGGMSTDVMPLKIQDNKIFIGSREILLNDFERLIGDDTWVIQKRIENQHEGYRCFHQNSINTLRVVSVNANSKIEIIGAELRIGINNSYNDNSSSGGLSVGIDIDTGALEKYAVFMPGRGGTKVASHPNSGVVFEGYILPLWEEVKQAVERIHTVFYGVYSIGWDVCVTSEGPIFIEGNDNWDCLTLQEYRGAITLYKKFFA